jgi:Domain of unknown function (DUF4395)
LQFAQIVGACFSGGSTLAVYIFVDGLEDNNKGEIAARVLMSVLAACAFIEGAFDFCLGCMFYKIFEKLGIFSSDPSKKCDDISADTASTLNVRLRMCVACWRS